MYSGSCKVSISSRICNSLIIVDVFWFELGVLFYKDLAEQNGIYCTFVRIVVCLGVRGELQVLKVLIIVNAFL